MYDYPYAAKRHLTALIDTLRPVVQRHPKEVVDPSDIEILRVVLDTVKDDMPDNRIVAAIVDRFSRGSGDEIKAVSLLVVGQQLDAAIGDVPPMVA